jgi:TonB-linked SusC/RagA family outer membrane protein
MTIREFYQKPRQGLVMNVRWRALSVLLLMLFVTTLSAFEAVAQERSITGKVMSAKENAPIPGVNILIKGTNRGTVTDQNGQFTLLASDGDILVVSQIGMEGQEITVGARTTIDISLAESTAVLEEVVVTALGISQEKRGLGYAVSTVSGSSVSETQRPNFMASLQGRVPGLTVVSTSGLPGSSTSITLRGVASLTGSNQPLIVVDGLPVDNRVTNQHSMVTDADNRNNDYINRAADINPSDIESLTILKGPEAAALYGQDGASGAIIITTKRGASGAVKIGYDNNFGWQTHYLFPEVQKVYGRGNFGYDDPSTQETQYFGPKYADGSTFYNNVDAFFKTGTTQNHNLSVEGGSQALTNRLSVNYYTQEGVVPNTDYEKFSAKLSTSSKFAEKLEFVSSINFILSSNSKAVRGINGPLLGVLTWPANDDMTVYLNPDGTRRRLLPDAPPTYYGEPNNPFFTMNKNVLQDKTNRFISNIMLNYDPVKWLTITGQMGADVFSTQGNNFNHPESGGTISPVITTNNIVAGGYIENYLEDSKLFNGQLLSTFRKDIGKFKTSLLIGTSFYDKNYETNTIYGSGLQLKEFNSINNTTPTTRNNKASIIRQRMASVFGNLTVNYSDLIYLSVTGRNDWSSTMPVQNNSYFYPSVAVSFVFSELAALENLSWLSFGKLRASYAEVGKDAPPYNVKSALIGRAYTGGGFNYNFWGGNPNLKPERAEGFEIGTELKFLKGRVGVDFSVFKNDRINQIASQRLSYGTGFVFGLLNGGHISVRGVELQLTATPVVINDFEWNVTVNFSKSESKVIELPAEVKEYYNSDTWIYANARGSAFPSNLQSLFSATAYPNYNWDYLQDGLGSATAIGGLTYERNSNGDILINPANGLPVKTADFLPIGERTPDFMLGLINSFTYKDFSLSFLLDFRKGGDVFNGNEMYLFNNGLSTRSLNREEPVVIKGVLKDGLQNSANPTVNTIQLSPYILGSTYGTAFAESDFVEHDINWVRLRDITLAYTLPSSVVSKSRIFKTASVFVTATDLFLITNYTGADPMTNGTTAATNGAGAFGFDFGTLSLPRTISTGIRVSL